jgi:hypothetical protein
MLDAEMCVADDIVGKRAEHLVNPVLLVAELMTESDRPTVDRADPEDQGDIGPPGEVLSADESDGTETPMASLLALAANITRSHGECWPLEASTMWSAALQGALDVALHSAATVDDALRVAARHGRVRAPI